MSDTGTAAPGPDIAGPDEPGPDEVVNPPTGAPLLEVRNLCKYYGNVIALAGDHDDRARPGRSRACSATTAPASRRSSRSSPACTSTSDGRGAARRRARSTFNSPRDALDRGIATVYQDLAVVPLMSVWRNFWLGDEPQRGFGPFRWIDIPKAKRIAKEELLKMGIDIRDTGAARRHAVGRRAAVRGHRPRRLPRRPGADPRRADLGARRQAVGRRAALHRRGGQPQPRRDLHHPQPAPRLPGRRPLPASSTAVIRSATSPRRRSPRTS